MAKHLSCPRPNLFAASRRWRAARCRRQEPLDVHSIRSENALQLLPIQLSGRNFEKAGDTKLDPRIQFWARPDTKLDPRIQFRGRADPKLDPRIQFRVRRFSGMFAKFEFSEVFPCV